MDEHIGPNLFCRTSLDSKHTQTEEIHQEKRKNLHPIFVILLKCTKINGCSNLRNV